LYDSAEYWAQQGVSEGFGLQPMEALACGCHVFSSVNGGLSDYLDPGFNCHKIAGYSKEYDIERILNVVKTSESITLPEQFFAEHRTESIIKRLQVILGEINQFFDQKQYYSTEIKDLTKIRIFQLNAQRLLNKALKRVRG
ncbi:MAG TPA: glycosyltransferase, partial [Phormidium sp.]